MKKKVFFISNLNNKYLQDLNFLAKKLDDIECYIILRWKNEYIDIWIYSFLSFIDIDSIEKLIQLSKINKKSSFIIYWTGLYRNQYSNLFFKNILEISHWYRPDINYFNKKYIYWNSLSEGIFFKFKTIYRYLSFYWIMNSFLWIFSEFFFKESILIKRFDLWIPEFLHFSENIVKNKNNILKGKNILFIEEPFLNTLNKVDKNKFKKFINNFAKINKEYNIVFKLHPRSNKEEYNNLFVEKNIILKEWNIINYLYNSTFVIWFASTPIILSLFIKKTIFIVDPIGLYKNSITSLSKIANIPFYKKEFKIYNYKLNTNKEELNKLIFDIKKFKKLIS